MQVDERQLGGAHMERVDIPSGSYPLRQEPSGEKRVGKKKPLKRTAFGLIERSEADSDDEGVSFESVGSSLSDTELEAMLDDIHRLGDLVRKQTSLGTMRDYRKAVGAFIHVVVERGLTIEENSSGHNILNRKKFALIKVIDERLERLASGVLQTQKDQLDILARIDEINGLLVDLVR